eukprot:scaffold1021_cov241-Pinguiococcus_pyrenoidosus.AAC.3
MDGRTGGVSRHFTRQSASCACLANLEGEDVASKLPPRIVLSHVVAEHWQRVVETIVVAGQVRMLQDLSKASRYGSGSQLPRLRRSGTCLAVPGLVGDVIPERRGIVIRATADEARGYRSVPFDVLVQTGIVFVVEGRKAAEEDVRDDAKGPDVDLDAIPFVPKNLRCHIPCVVFASEEQHLPSASFDLGSLALYLACHMLYGSSCCCREAPQGRNPPP